MTDAKTKKTAAKKPTEKKVEVKAEAIKNSPSKKELKKPQEKTLERKSAEAKELSHKKVASTDKKVEKKTSETPAPASPKTETAPAISESSPTTPTKKKITAPKAYPISKIKYQHTKKKAAPSKTKPRFLRQEGLRYKRLEDVWRRPTGIDSKKLEKKRGKGCLPSIGYKKPSFESGKQYGMEAVRVFNVSELAKIDPKNQLAVIAASVGRRKRNLVIEEANKRGIIILNPRRGEV